MAYYNEKERLLIGESLPKVDERGLGAYIFDACDKYAERICQIDADLGIEESYQSVKKRSISVAVELKKLGIKKNDVVLICSNNTLDGVIPIVACFFIGAAVSCLDPSMSVKENKYLIDIIKPKTMVVQDITLPLIQTCLDEIGLEVDFIIIGQSEKYPTIRQLATEKSEDAAFNPVIIEDARKEIACILFSSGTSGLPKGICLSHYGLLHAHYAMLAKEVNSEVYFHVSTPYWISAMGAWIMCFISGGKKILTANSEAASIMKIIQEYKVTSTLLASLYAYKVTMVPNMQEYDVSSLHCFLVSGSYLPGEQIDNVRKALGKPVAFLGYGMTENSGAITIYHMNKEKELAVRKPGSSGTVAATITMKIADLETGERLGPKKTGEIRIKSPSLMVGYYNKDCSDQYDEEGFFKTGDLGYFEEDGSVYVVDRIKEMFKYQSWHILPVSIEKEIYQHEDVMEAVAFGVPHDIDGDRPAACVVLKKGSKVTEDELLTFINDRLSDREKLRGGLKIIDKLPKTATGKVSRNQTRSLYISSK